MASLEKRGTRFRVKFRFGGQQLGVALKTAHRKEAEGLLGKLEYNLALLERGHLQAPEGADLGLFLISDGKLSGKPTVKPPFTLAELFSEYRGRPINNKDPNTSRMEGIHMNHLERLIGPRQLVRAIATDVLQRYVDARSKEKWHRGPISHVTIEKEIGTFAAIWNLYAVPKAYVAVPAPTKGLVYQKAKAKSPFQTWEQIERAIRRGGLSEAEQDELWDSLYLSTDQIQQILDHVKQHARAPWVYPMFVFAARTGARRSEMMRSRIDDIDFDGGIVRIREKKRDREKSLTFRHVPVSPALETALREWLGSHPGGQFLFCRDANVPLTGPMADHHFDAAFADSKWRVLRGWHMFRHSFASNCASRGVDDRLIRSWMGHMTEEMSGRYRHLFPDAQKQALSLVFADGQ